MGFCQLTQELHLTDEQMGRIKVIGGGARNGLWMQMLADVLNTPVEQLAGNIGAAFGAALLAIYGDGQASDLRDLTRHTVQAKARYFPNPAHVPLYKKKYKKYKALHEALQLVRKV